jgi:predicted type IV restriction endonuclease
MVVGKMIGNLIDETRKVVENNPIPFKRGKKAEKNVEDNIVRPILRSLGWGKAPAQIVGKDKIVLKEKRGEADFVLYNGPKPVLGVEVKNLATIIRAEDMESSHVQQLVDYLHGLHPMPIFGLLTNGAVWQLLSVKGYVVELVWAIDLLDDDLGFVEDKLSDISPDNIEDLDSRLKAERRAAEAMKKHWKEITRNKSVQIDALAKALKERVEQSDKSVDLDYGSARQFIEAEYKGQPTLVTRALSTESQPPQEDASRGTMEIEGRKYKNRRFNQILQNTWEHLAETGKLANVIPAKLKEKPWIANAGSIDEARTMMQKHARPHESTHLRNWYIDLCHTTTEFIIVLLAETSYFIQGHPRYLGID